ncbi:HAAS signaling domain-containing protein [Kitasatospora sp. HPMI-4]|uniref:HAAS signaling domain-containing protein n=1 Tax=Kitasatospora sp. HPMI-4 TaxID=3448443 RepID=UPI003F1BFD2C
MNNPIEHPLVRAYLDELTRHTAPLPEERRRELLADLREHIEVTLADFDPADEEAVRQVLNRLGHPREIAAAALAEEGQACPEPESSGRTTLTLALALLPLPLLLVPVLGPVLALATAVTALIRVWKSPQWTRRDKKWATLLFVSPVVVTPLAAAALAASSAGLTPSMLLSAWPAGFCLPLLAAFRLARSAARLRTGAVTA